MAMAITTTRAERSDREDPPIGFDASPGALCLRVALVAVLSFAMQTAYAQSGSVSDNTAAGSAMPALSGPLTAGQISVGAGDLLDIEIFGTPELSGKLRVDQKGILHLPFGTDLSVEGLTATQAAGRIEKALRDEQIMIDPHISVFVVESATQGVTLLGEVKSPGIYPLFGPHSVSDALAAAGGATPTEGGTITVTHRNDPQHSVSLPVTSPNYADNLRLTMVSPGDTIVVTKAPIFYVVGDVARPGSYFMPNGEPVTILNALALASGLNNTAKGSKASIVRPTPDGGAETIPVDIDKIIKNHTSDVRLQATDVLVVPRSRVKVVLEQALPGVTSTVTSSVATALVLR